MSDGVGTFHAEVEKLAQEAGLNLDKSTSGASLVFRFDAGGKATKQRIWVFPFRDETMWEFACYSLVAHASDLDEFPKRLLISSLRENAGGVYGFWCLEDMGGEYALTCMHNISSDLINGRELKRICNSLAYRVDKLERAVAP